MAKYAIVRFELFKFEDLSEDAKIVAEHQVTNRIVDNNLEAFNYEEAKKEGLDSNICYEVSYEEILEYINCYELEFLEDGSIFDLSYDYSEEF